MRKVGGSLVVMGPSTPTGYDPATQRHGVKEVFAYGR